MTGLKNASTMNSLEQYLRLYAEYGETLCSGAPAALNAPRAAAAAALAGARLPRRGDDGYAATDLNAMFAPDYGINITRMPFRADIAAAFRCDVPNISTLLGIVANDVYAPSASLLRLLPEGVTVCSFAEAAKKCPGILEKYYNRLTPGDDAAVDLNTLLAQDGVLIHVAAGVTLDKPIQLVNILGGVTTPILAIRRLLVVAERNAECRILVCDHSNGSDVSNAASTVAEFFVSDGARVQYYDMEESTPVTSRFAALYASVGASASLLMNMTTLRCGTTRNNIRVSLDGEGAECRLNGMAITDGGQHADNSSTVEHPVPHCTSSQLFKYVADDNSACAFEGLIHVHPGAYHTEAYQNNRNMLASEKARMHTQPQLLIYCDDVKCSHGAATGQISADALFYMRSRGIPLATARTMLMQAFMADVIDTVSLEPLRDRLRYLVDRRLSGEHSDCEGCAAKS